MTLNPYQSNLGLCENYYAKVGQSDPIRTPDRPHSLKPKIFFLNFHQNSTLTVKYSNATSQVTLSFYTVSIAAKLLT